MNLYSTYSVLTMTTSFQVLLKEKREVLIRWLMDRSVNWSTKSSQLILRVKTGRWVAFFTWWAIAFCALCKNVLSAIALFKDLLFAILITRAYWVRNSPAASSPLPLCQRRIHPRSSVIARKSPSAHRCRTNPQNLPSLSRKGCAKVLKFTKYPTLKRKEKNATSRNNKNNIKNL